MIKKIYKKSLGLLLAAAMMLSVAGCSDMKKAEVATQQATEATTSVAYADSENAEFQQYIKDAFEEDVMASTITYHSSVKDFASFGLERPTKAYWIKDMPKGTAEEIFATEKKKIQDRYDRLMSFEGAALTEDEYFTFLTEKSSLEVTLKAYDYPLMAEQFYPGKGVQSQLGPIFAEYIFNDKQDIEDYLTLMETFPEYVEYSCTINDWRASQGYAMQDNMADVVIEQCNTFNADKDNHFLTQEFANKIDAADFLSADEKAAYKEKEQEAIQKLFEGVDMIKKDVTANKGKSSVTGGLCKYPEGKDYINNYLIPANAGCEKTGDELVAEYDKRIGQIQTEISMIMQSNPEAYQYCMENAATAFAEFDKKDITQAVDAITEVTMDEYPELPKINYHASNMSQVTSDILSTWLAYYLHPAFDDLDNNVIRANINHPENKWLTLSHEGCPGHMYQFNYYMSTNPNPLRMISSTLAYKEGWAVYSCYNTYDEFDFPDTDDDEIIGKFFRLQAELGYLVNERIDLGINYEGWDVAAFGEFVTKLGVQPEMAEQLYATYSVNTPGVYLNYTEAYYQMNGMREYAEKKLGSRFDPVEFHKVVLTAGPCMYKDLKFKVDEYIEKNR